MRLLFCVTVLSSAGTVSPLLGPHKGFTPSVFVVATSRSHEHQSS
jgi:hypothetical protein